MSTKDADPRLPLRDSRNQVPARRVILASHLIWTGYGHWLLYTPEDVRGRIEYVRQGPVKESLAQQRWEFVRAFWPC